MGQELSFRPFLYGLLCNAAQKSQYAKYKMWLLSAPSQNRRQWSLKRKVQMAMLGSLCQCHGKELQQSLQPSCPQRRRRNHQLLIPVSMDLQIVGGNMNSKSTENQGGIKSLGYETRSNSITTHCTTHDTLGLFFFFFAHRGWSGQRTNSCSTQEARCAANHSLL